MKPLVLIVDDNADDRFLFREAITKSGFPAEVLFLHDGREARDYLAGEGSFTDRGKHRLPLLVITDVRMPRMTGIELLSWTRQHSELKRLPLILMSTSKVPADVNSAYAYHASSYVVKPTHFTGLIAFFKAVSAYWLEFGGAADASLT